MVDINVIMDEQYVDPKVNILTKDKTKQVENIIYAIENASENDFPALVGSDDSKLVLISQRDIVRVYIQGRKVLIQTDDGVYMSKKPLSVLEDILNGERFVRISQSEIINLYKVSFFDVTVSGTIGIEFDNGTRSWVARSRVKDIRRRIRDKFSGG